MKQKTDTFAHLIAIFTVIVWGTTFISTKVLLQDFSPIEILFIRFVLGFIALFLFNPRFMRVKESKHTLYFIGAGISGVTLYFLFENIALQHSPASNIGVLVSVAPFFTAILSHFFVERANISKQFYIGFLCAIIGIVIISFRNATNVEFNPIGDILAILAAFVWAIYSNILKKIGTFEYNNIQVTRRIFFFGILFMIPFLFFMDFSIDVSSLTKFENLGNLVFLGIVASALCFVSWNHAINVLGAMRASAYIYLVPVVTILASAIILNEPITIAILIGSAFILTGLYLSERKSK